jgi:hypothetical protein
MLLKGGNISKISKIYKKLKSFLYICGRYFKE